jgi:oligogalacturonide lyase
MTAGVTTASEAIVLKDPKSGARVRQVTSDNALHHHPFFYIPPYDDAMARLLLISHRSGSPQVFAEDRGSGRLVQLTDTPELDEWSLHPAHSGEFVYFTAGASLRRVHCETFVQEELLHLGKENAAEAAEAGSVGGAMRTTTLSHDDRWWALTVKVGGAVRLLVVDTESGDYEVIVERRTMFHPQFHPGDSSLLRYASSHAQRMWIVARDGSDHRLAYERDTARKEWVTHETWLPGGRELLAADWPHGVFAVDVDSDERRGVVSFNAWHPVSNRQGTIAVADTNWPDQGIHVFDPHGNLAEPEGVEEPRFVCDAKASNLGEHWKTDHCVYDDGPVQVYAPQHTHPHPHFSPDSQRLVFTSDRTGVAQVYEVELTPELLGERLASLCGEGA